MKKTIIVTGDRPSGPLHVGHYVGSLRERVALQDAYKQYVMIADIQALTDNFAHPEKVHANVMEVALDYLAVGIDPKKTTIFIQSTIPEIAELTIIYLNLVTVNRLMRNPTVKTEIQSKQFGESVPAGFLIYPVHQAADITIFNGNLVPVGEDQLPILEQANEIVRSFNRIYGQEVFSEITAHLSSAPRLMGLDGKAKMSKSLGNAIYLSDATDVVVKKVMSMYTDPDHIQVSMPGKVEGNVVFMYLDVFDPDKAHVAALKEQYQKGGLGDVALKRYLIDVLENVLHPIRTKRLEYAADMDYVKQVLHNGNAQAQEAARETMAKVRQAVKLVY